MHVELVMLPNHLTLCCHLLLLPSIFPSIRVSSSELVLISGDQSIRASASASTRPKKVLLDWFIIEIIKHNQCI